jgi:HEAT repeat protein
MPDLFEDELETLVNDTNTKVAVLAIRAIGAGTTPGIISSVLDRLGEPDLTSEAVETLGRCGDGIVDLVSERLVNGSTPIEIRREIPRVLLNIGTVAAKKVLMESLLVGDTKLRSQIIASLASLQSRHPDFDLDVQMIESLVVAEIIGHYRSYQIQETLDKALDRDNGMFKALQESMKNDLERIFQLIKLLNPEYDLKSAYVGIHSDSPQVRANALEFLEHILKPELRNLLVPALDPDVSSAKRAQLTERLIGATMETPTEALLALMDDAEPWLKSNAVYTIGILGLTALEPKIDECLEHSDPLLRETARQAKKRLASSSKTKSPESKNTKSQ